MYAFDDADAPNSKERQYYEMFGNRAIWVDGWKAVTMHANRMPWDLNAILPFDEDEWELYHVAEDFSESTNLAEEQPERPAELVAIFDEEAWKYNVYPLYDDMISRVSAQQDRLFGDKTGYFYYAPGAVRIGEKASAPVKGRSHTIDTTIDLQGGEEGVIVAVGGMTVGSRCSSRMAVSFTTTTTWTACTTSCVRHRCLAARPVSDSTSRVPDPSLAYSLAETFDVGATQARRSPTCIPACSSSTVPSIGSSSICWTRRRPRRTCRVISGSQRPIPSLRATVFPTLFRN